MKNKIMFGLDYNVASEEIISISMKNFKVLAISSLGSSIFLLRVPEMEETGVLMRKHKQVCSIHLAMMECISTIELLGILDLETEGDIRIKDKNSEYKIVKMSIRSILSDITILSVEKPLFLMIAPTTNGEYEGVVPVGGERKEEAKKIADHVTSAVMYRLIFNLHAHQDNIGTFLIARFSKEHVNITMGHSFYKGQPPPDSQLQRR